jgi:hypothetical protein
MSLSKSGWEKMSGAPADADPHGIRKDLAISNGTELLLIFGWVTDEELRMAKMHPDFFAFDVTHQTNQEKRDMFVGVGKDGNNKAFHGFHALLPSQKRWVFGTLYTVVLPKLWGPQIMLANRLALTDGDKEEYLSLHDAM